MLYMRPVSLISHQPQVCAHSVKGPFTMAQFPTSSSWFHETFSSSNNFSVRSKYAWFLCHKFFLSKALSPWEFWHSLNITLGMAFSSLWWTTNPWLCFPGPCVFFILAPSHQIVTSDLSLQNIAGFSLGQSTDKSLINSTNRYYPDRNS